MGKVAGFLEGVGLEPNNKRHKKTIVKSHDPAPEIPLTRQLHADYLVLVRRPPVFVFRELRLESRNVVPRKITCQ